MVNNPVSRNPLDTSDIECKEQLDTGSSFLDFAKSNGDPLSDNDSNELLRFNDVFVNRVNVLANKSVNVNAELDTDKYALLELPIARTGLECKNKIVSPLIKKVKGEVIAPAGGNVRLRQRATPGKQSFVTLTFDYKVTVGDKFSIINSVSLQVYTERHRRA